MINCGSVARDRHRQHRFFCYKTVIKRMRNLLRIAILVAILLTSIAVIPNALVAADWVAECNESGFNPEQLACHTCNILPTEFLDQCQKCCQSWLDIKRITKPYTAAVVIDRGSSGDVETFFNENWDEVVAIKGTHQLQKIQTPREQGFHYFMARPSQVLFFDDTTPTKIIKNNKLILDLPNLMKKAKEVVNLDGMKREDIKDMLLTLLP